MASAKLKNVYLNEYYSIIGPLESEGTLKNVECIMDYYNNSKTFEQAEINLNRRILDKLVTNKTKLLISGELSNQLTASTYASKNTKLPYLGVYSACSSFVEGLIIAAVFNNTVKESLVYTSAHNLTAEKQFRYPIEYGSPRPLYTTFTATGASGVIVSKRMSNIKIESYTIGYVVDYDIKDASNMGAVMAPAVYENIKKHMHDLDRSLSYYDLVLTGDLGKYGLKILKDLLAGDNITYQEIMDAGCEIYKSDQDTYAGGSGPVCLPLILFNKILKSKKYGKILLVGSGALHSKIMTDQKLSIPSISHLVSLEVIS